MNIIFFGLVLVGVFAGQECVDIPPTITFPCDFQTLNGGCDPPYDALKDTEGRIVYCLVTCDLCECIDTCTCTYFEGSRRSSSKLPQAIESNMTEAIYSIMDNDFGPDPTVPIVRAANAAAQAVANAIASAMAEVDLRGVFADKNSFAFCVANDSATDIASATAEAYAVAISEAGSDFTELEASDLITNTQRALINSAVELAGTDRGTIDTVRQTYAAVVAEGVINSTAQAFAKLTGSNAQAIALSTIQAFNTSQLICLSTCNKEPPFGDKTCFDYVTSGECPSIAGSCECACDTCSLGSKGSVRTYINLISGSDIYQTIKAFGKAFAAGSIGVNAIAGALVQAVTQGHANATANTIAEAIGAVNQIPINALVNTLTSFRLIVNSL